MSKQQTEQNHRSQILQPREWARPRGYANGMVASGRLVFVSGQIGWGEQCRFQSSDVVAQARQVLQHILTILAEAHGRPEHIVRLTWYVVDKHEYLARQKELGQLYPAMTAVQVSALIEDQALVEIEATAVIPERMEGKPIALYVTEAQQAQQEGGI